MSPERAAELIENFKGAKVLVIGDLIMDHFIWGKVKRISPEAPVPVVEVTSESLMLGGSANVVNNIISLGGGSLVTGVVGRDDDGKKFIKFLKDKDIPTDGIVVDSSRPTTVKTRIIAHNQQVVRFDRESKAPLGSRVLSRVMRYVRKAASRADIVVISDYAKGLVTRELVEETVDAAKASGKPVAVDPKVEHFDMYRGVTIVTPNNLEASIASGIEIEDGESLSRAGTELTRSLGCEALLVTRGEHGMCLFEGGSEVHIPTMAREVYDVSGAGDTVMGVLALALASGADFREAAVLANFAAGVVVGKIGTATVTPEELTKAASDGLEAGLKARAVK